MALAAAAITTLGYLGFTGAQILAGAKLASGTMFTQPAWGLSPLYFSLLVIALAVKFTTVLDAMLYVYSFYGPGALHSCAGRLFLAVGHLHKKGSRPREGRLPFSSAGFRTSAA